MSGLYRTHGAAASAQPLPARLRELRRRAGLPGWKVAAAGQMDSGLWSKIENGKRAITQAQLAAVAAFFGIEAGPLEAVRLAEEIHRRYGENPALPEATNLLQEQAGEYLVKKMSTAASKPASPVSKSKKAR